MGQRSRSNAKNRVLTSLLVAFDLDLRSRSKVGVKVKGQGQRSGSRSKVMVKFLVRSGRY